MGTGGAAAERMGVVNCASWWTIPIWSSIPTRGSRSWVYSRYARGALPVFESRAYGEFRLALPQLAAKWAEETLGVTGAMPFVSVLPHKEKAPYIAVSLGVGENPAKRIADPFEEKLLEMLSQTGLGLWIDRGAGGEEDDRVTLAAKRAQAKARLWGGDFAPFASIIAGSSLYVGYDSASTARLRRSADQHFAGFPCSECSSVGASEQKRRSDVWMEPPDVDEVLHASQGNGKLADIEQARMLTAATSVAVLTSAGTRGSAYPPFCGAGGLWGITNPKVGRTRSLRAHPFAGMVRFAARAHHKSPTERRPPHWWRSRSANRGSPDHPEWMGCTILRAAANPQASRHPAYAARAAPIFPTAVPSAGRIAPAGGWPAPRGLVPGRPCPMA